MAFPISSPPVVELRQSLRAGRLRPNPGPYPIRGQRNHCATTAAPYGIFVGSPDRDNGRWSLRATLASDLDNGRLSGARADGCRAAARECSRPRPRGGTLLLSPDGERTAHEGFLPSQRAL